MGIAIAILLALLAGSCASAPATIPGGAYVAEDVQHVVTIVVLDRDADLDAFVESLRAQPGNLAVFLLRREGRTVVIAEWRTVADAERSGSMGEQYDVLFEAARFDAREE